MCAGRLIKSLFSWRDILKLECQNLKQKTSSFQNRMRRCENAEVAPPLRVVGERAEGIGFGGLCAPFGKVPWWQEVRRIVLRRS